MATAQFAPVVEPFFDPATWTFSYVVHQENGKDAVIIDSVLDYDPKAGRTRTTNADKVIEYVRQHDLMVHYIMETHVHADHLTAAPYLRDTLGGEIVIGKEVTQVEKIFFPLFNEKRDELRGGKSFDLLVGEEDSLMAGEMPIAIMHTPGHTPACISFVIGDAIFVGDTLFMPDYGTARCDFPGGNAQTLWDSMQKILSLPDETRMFMCHDYRPGGRPEACLTTVDEQKAQNIHLIGKTGDEFANMRQERDKDLATPVLLLPSVQINMIAGNLPAEDDNGVHYIKIPMNKIGSA